jgi:hypothetical protein
MATVPGMDIVEDFLAFLWRDATLNHTGDAMFVQLAVDEDEGLAAPLDHPCLCLILR